MKIALSVALATLIFVGCGDTTTKEMTQETKYVAVETTQVAQNVVNKVDEVVKKVVEKVNEKEKIPKSGADLYSSCAGCHGSSADKKALGKSAVIKGWSVDKLQTTLKGYKDGSYGGNMKAVMKGQVMKLNDEEIILISEHISKL